MPDRDTLTAAVEAGYAALIRRWVVEPANGAGEPSLTDVRGDARAVLTAALPVVLADLADQIEDECTHSQERCFCRSAPWLRRFAADLTGEAQQ